MKTDFGEPDRNFIRGPSKMIVYIQIYTELDGNCGILELYCIFTFFLNYWKVITFKNKTVRLYGVVRIGVLDL